MQVKLWKDYKKIVFALIFILFNFCFITKVNALALKMYDTISNINNAEQSGLITTTTADRLIFQWDPKANTNNYEYIGFRISPLYSTTNISNMSLSPLDMECKKYTEHRPNAGDTYYTCDQWEYNGTIPSSNITLNEGMVGFSGYITYTGQGGGVNSPCFYTPDFEGVFICKYVPNANTLVYYVNNYRNTSVNYKVGLSNQIIWFNSDSFEIVSALDSLGVIQQNTSTTINNNLTTIQQQNTQQQQYLENDNTSGTQQQVTTDITSTTTDLGTATNSVNDLTNIIMLPITLFTDLSTSTCTPIHLVVPFVNVAFDLPCMSTIYNAHFSGFLTIFSTVICTITCYWISIKSFKLIKELLDCDNDRIEVLDL